MKFIKHDQKPRRKLWQFKRFWAFILLILCMVFVIFLLASSEGARMIMQTAPNKPKGAEATPPLSAQSIDEWESTGRADAQEKLQTHIYGTKVEPHYIFGRRTLLDDNAFNDKGLIYELDLDVKFGAQVSSHPNAPKGFRAILIMPKNQDEAVPVIMMENFCPNHSVIPHPKITKPSGAYYNCDGEGFMHSVFGFFFGRYITTPPIEMILERGYAIAALYPHEYIPDDGEAGLATLQALFPFLHENERPGAVMAWAEQFSTLRKFLENGTQPPQKDAHWDKLVNISHTIAYGHSRFGKSALVAAAFDQEIDAVIAHQSGTGGASLSKEKPGESVADITNGYPHWFSPVYRAYGGREGDMPVDQHHLLALIAPRPVMLSNAKRDVWSDPNGAFRAAQGANSVYALYGSDGLRQKKLNKFDPSADIAFWMRRGTHGVVKEDWPAFLEFLDAHFK